MDVSGHHQASTDSTQADLVTVRNAEAGSALIAQYQLMITRMFGIAVDILNVARDRKSTRLNSSHSQQSRMPSSA